MKQFFNRFSLVSLSKALICGAVLHFGFVYLETTAHADNAYFAVSPGTPFQQDWSNGSQITANDNWGGVPSINGYEGQDAAGVQGTDPQTVVSDHSGIPDVNANQTVPGSFSTAGVAEFAIANPVVALSGSGLADFPNLDIRIDTNSCTTPNALVAAYNIRDLDDSGDNSTQQVALQYRIGATGNYTNIPAGFIADATTGPLLATLVTSRSVTLPSNAQGQPQVHVRVITANAPGNDEWVGVDDINISCITATAAEITLAGRVRNQANRGIAKVFIVVSDESGRVLRTTFSNAFGYFGIDGLAPGRAYSVSANSRLVRFEPPTFVLAPNDNVDNIEFVSVP